MTLQTQFPIQATTALANLAFSAIRMVLLQESKASRLTLSDNNDDLITVQTAQGLISFARDGQGTIVTVSADRPDALFTIKERLMLRLTELAPQVIENLRWSDATETGNLPANFQLVTVLSVIPVGTVFLRVRVQARDLSGFGDDSIHLRLALPLRGQDPVEWPSVAANGSTVWPKGDKALHNPVYTTRWLDKTTGEMDIDVFLHDGGQVTDWASNVKPGTKVGIVGPVGRGIPKTRKILLIADETALPAAARIMETLSENTIGHVTLLTDNGKDCAYPLTAPTGVSITWLSRRDSHNLAELAQAAHRDLPDHFLWFAGEKCDVQIVRTAFKERQGDPSDAYMAVYWG